MKPDTQLLHSVWNNSSQILSKTNVDLGKKNFDEVIASVFSSGPFYFFIIDFADMKIKYMSHHIKDIHGLETDEVKFEDILNLIHPEDMNYVAQAEKKVIEVLYTQLGKDKVTKYKSNYCFRCRVPDGSYQLFNHQSLVMTLDEDGRTSQSLNIHTNISHLTDTNNYKLSMIGIMGEPSFSNINVFDTAQSKLSSKSLFSKREKEIIRVLADGLTTTQIAEKLFVAHSTIKNHRKRILEKAGCKNTGQLISKCILEGLI